MPGPVADAGTYFDCYGCAAAALDVAHNPTTIRGAAMAGTGTPEAVIKS